METSARFSFAPTLSLSSRAAQTARDLNKGLDRNFTAKQLHNATLALSLREECETRRASMRGPSASSRFG